MRFHTRAKSETGINAQDAGHPLRVLPPADSKALVYKNADDRNHHKDAAPHRILGCRRAGTRCPYTDCASACRTRHDPEGLPLGDREAWVARAIHIRAVRAEVWLVVHRSVT